MAIGKLDESDTARDRTKKIENISHLCNDGRMGTEFGIFWRIAA